MPSRASSVEPALRRVWKAMDWTVARVFFTRWFSSLIRRVWRSAARWRSLTSRWAAIHWVTVPSSPVIGVTSHSTTYSVPSFR